MSSPSPADEVPTPGDRSDERPATESTSPAPPPAAASSATAASSAADGGVDLSSPASAREYSRGWAWLVVLAMLAALPVAWLGLREIRLKNDVESWLPADDPNKIALDWFHQHFEQNDRMLVSWETATLEDPRVAAFAEAVLEVPFVVDSVTPQQVIDRMVENRIDRATATARLEGILIGSGRLSVQLSEEGRRRREALVVDLQTRAAAEFDFPLTITLVPEAAQPPAGEGAIAAEEEIATEEVGAANGGDEATAEPAAAAFERGDLQISWPGITPGSERTEAVRAWIESIAGDGDEADARVPLVEAVAFRAGSPVAVSVSVADGEGRKLRPLIDRVREVAAAVGVPPEELRMGGSPVAGAGLNDNVLKAAWNPDAPLWNLPRRSPVGLSLLVGVVLAFIMLRSIRLAVLVLLVAIFTTVITVALVPPTGGSMSMVLVVMPSLLLVLTMSGAIHVANYWRHASSEMPGAPSGAPVLQAAKQAAAPCAMASLTTGIGLASLMTSPLVPVRDFGLYSAIGCVISLGLVLVGFPSLLRILPGRGGSQVSDEAGRWVAIGKWINRHGTAVAVVCLAIMLAGTAGLHRFRTETKVIRYFPGDARIVQDYTFLEENLAGIVPVTVLVGFEGDDWSRRDFHEQLTLVRRVEAALAEHPEISGTLALPDFVPEVTPEMNRLKARTLQRKVYDLVQESVAADGEPTAAAQFVTRVREPLAISDEGRPVRFDVATFAEGEDAEDAEDADDLGRELYKITAQVSILTDLDYRPFLEQVDAIVRETIAEWEDEQREEFFDEAAEGEQPAGEAAGDDVAAVDRRVEYIVTGTVPLFLRTQEAVLESLIRSFGLAFAVIAVVMMVILRSPVAGIITMIPNLLPVGLVFGLISWVGIPVDIGTMITASVALGVAVDGTLHLLTWFRERLGRGRTAGQAIGAGLSHCGPAMFQTSTVVALGLLCLMFSDLLLISRFGWLMAALITAALFADLVFLPSLLSGVLGRVIERRIHPETAEQATESVTETPTSLDAA